MVALGPSGQICTINRGWREDLRLMTACKWCMTFVIVWSGIYKWNLIMKKKTALKTQIKDMVSKKQTKELRH